MSIELNCNEALRLLDEQIAALRYKRRKGFKIAKLLVQKAALLRKIKDSEGARLAALEAVKVSSAHPNTLSELRRCNPKAKLKSKCYYITVQGLAPLMSLFGNKDVGFMGSYEVVAENKSEALRYIREIQIVSDPSSLEIIESKRRKRVAHDGYHGVLFAYRSISWEAPPKDVPEELLKNFSQFH